MPQQVIIGREQQIRQVRSAMAHNRLASAYLLIGPSGVGKRLFARAWAASLLCEQSPEAFSACGSCDACLLVQAETHPDFTCVRKPEDKQEFPISLMHEVLATLGLKPARGRWKIVLIEDADDLNQESANAFLKSLEEPPEGSLLLLRSSVAETQLPTILSRCQRIYLPPLQLAEVETVLAAHGIEDAEKRQRLAAMSGGSPGRALAMNDPKFDDYTRLIHSAILSNQINAATLAQRWLELLESFGKDGARQREQTAVALQLLLHHLKHLLRLSLAEQGGADNAAVRARQLGPERLMTMLEACLDADQQVAQRVSLPITLELLADRIAQAK